MKWGKFVLVSILLALLLSACAPAEQVPTEEVPTQTTQAIVEQTGAEEPLTEQALLELFAQNNGEETVYGCVVVPDSAYGVAGVVQCANRDNDGVSLWFLDSSGGVKGCAGTPDCTPVPGTLEYVGGDAVSCRFQTKEGAEGKITVYYEANEEGVNFRVVSEK